MPKPEFENTQSEEVADLRKDVESFAQQLGPVAGSKDLGMLAIATTETAIPHGQRRVPKWFLYSGPNVYTDIKATKAADDKFIYLSAAVACTVGIVVF